MATETAAPQTKTYYVWIIAQKETTAETLVAKMIRRGYTVGPLGRSLITSHSDNPACVVAMTLYRNPKNDQERKDYNALGIHNEVTDVIKLIKGKFWGIVVSTVVECTWNIGNMSLEADQKERFETSKKVN